MKKSVGIALLAVSLLLLFVAACTPPGTPSRVAPETETDEQGEANEYGDTQPSASVAKPKAAAASTGPASGETFVGTFEKAVQLNVPIHCIWGDNQGNKVDYYINGKKTRMVTTNSGGQKTYLLAIDRCTYIWNDDTPQGSETCTTQQLSPEEEEAAKNAAVPAIGGIVINCYRGNIPESTFAKPSNVKFIDTMQMLESMGYGSK